MRAAQPLAGRSQVGRRQFIRSQVRSSGRLGRKGHGDRDRWGMTERDYWEQILKMKTKFFTSTPPRGHCARGHLPGRVFRPILFSLFGSFFPFFDKNIIPRIRKARKILNLKTDLFADRKKGCPHARSREFFTTRPHAMHCRLPVSHLMHVHVDHSLRSTV
jgi:hypothetical protein